jgi:uncharacterized NAD(P)/FAD-binding protein YdhS
MIVYQQLKGSLQSEQYSIGVVGAGATAVSFIQSFVSMAMKHSIRNVNIVLFEKRSHVGPGLPYQEDYLCLRLNRPAEDMSVVPGHTKHFVNWLKSKSEYRELLLESEYIPRSVFGKYLSDTLQQAIDFARDSIKIDIINMEVTDIVRDNRILLITEDRTVFSFNVVLISTGIIQSKDYYALKGSQNYIHSPYPLIKTLQSVNECGRIAIIGSSLTAIDVAITLKYISHKGSIDMISQFGRLPTVRGKDNFYNPKFLTLQAIEQHARRNHGKIRLRYILKLLRKEFLWNGLDWRDVIFGNSDEYENSESLTSKIQNAQYGSKWFDILRETHPTLDETWGLLDEQDKKVFIEHYLSHFLSKRASVPLINALQIQDMLRTGQLNIYGGLKTVSHDGTQFYALFHNGLTRYYDHVINATGPSRDLLKDGNSPFLNQLIKKGYAVQDPNGGIRVDFRSGAVLDREGVPDKHLRAVGHLACGTFFLINNLELIIKLTKTVASDVVHLILASQKVLKTNR